MNRRINKMKEIEIGYTRYDERNDRYVTPESRHTRGVYFCSVEEYNPFTEEYETAEDQLFTTYELLRMI